MYRQYRGGLRVLVPLDRSLALSIHSWKGDTPIPTTPDRLSGLTSLRPTTLGSSLHFSQHRCSFFYQPLSPMGTPRTKVLQLGTSCPRTKQMSSHHMGQRIFPAHASSLFHLTLSFRLQGSGMGQPRWGRHTGSGHPRIWWDRGISVGLAIIWESFCTRSSH